MKSISELIRQSNRIQSMLYLRECKARKGCSPNYYKVDREQRRIQEITNKLINKTHGIS